jgi:hypothetical protein
MRTKFIKGISLIVIVITIVIVIILAGVTILVLTKNNPIENAQKSAFLSDLDSFKSELLTYESKLLTNNIDFDVARLQADDDKVMYTFSDTVPIEEKNIRDIITGLANGKYMNEFEILNGKLTYKGANIKRQRWSIESGIIIDSDKTNVVIATNQIDPVKDGTNIEYTLRIYSTVGIKDIGDLNGKIVVTDDQNILLSTQPKLIIGEIISSINEKQISVIIDTTGLLTGNYKIKLLSDAVENNMNIKNLETESINTFSIDALAPTSPNIEVSPTTIVNGDVTVNITYPSDAVIKKYSTDGITWKIYTGSIIITQNYTTIYAIGIDEVGNQSSQSTLQITNIDKTIISKYTGTSLLATANQIKTGHYGYGDNGIAIDGSMTVRNLQSYVGTSTLATADKILKGNYGYKNLTESVEGTYPTIDSYTGTSTLATADKITKGNYGYNNLGKVVEGTNQSQYKYVTGSYNVTASSGSTYYSLDSVTMSQFTINTGLSNIVYCGASFSGYVKMAYTTWSPFPIVYYPSVDNNKRDCCAVSATTITHQAGMELNGITSTSFNIVFYGYRDGSSYAKQTNNMSFSISAGTVYWWAIGY